MVSKRLDPVTENCATFELSSVIEKVVSTIVRLKFPSLSELLIRSVFVEPSFEGLKVKALPDKVNALVKLISINAKIPAVINDSNFVFIFCSHFRITMVYKLFYVH